MKKIYSVIAAIIFLVAPFKAQTTFDKVYTVNGGEMRNIITTLDGKYMLSGTETTFGSGKWCLVKTDSLGTVLSKWKYDFGGVNARDCRVAQCPLDSGYFVYGLGDFAGNGRGRVIKVDKNGNFLWGKNFTNMVGAPILAGHALSNGQFLCGLGGSLVGDGYGIMKFSPGGGVIWSKSNQNNSSNLTYKIIEASDGNYIFAGAALLGGPQLTANVAKIDTSGNLIWTKNISQTGWQSFFATNVCQTTDGGYAVITYGNCSCWINKLDMNGNLQWCNSTPFNGCYPPMDIVGLPGNDIGILGILSASAWAQLAIMNGTGTTTIQRKISVSGYSPQQNYGSFMRTANGSIPSGPIICGFTSDLGSPPYCYEAIRMKSNYTGCSIGTPTTVTTFTDALVTSPGFAFGSYTPPMTAAVTPTITNPAIGVIPYCSVAPLTASANGTNILCNGTCNGTATVTPAGGQGPFTYTWSPSGGNSATASALCANTYTVIVKDALSSTVTAVVTITQPSAISSVPSQTNLTCNGSNNGIANVSASGGTGSLTYSWSPSGGTSATASALAAGNYTCTIKDANNCTKTQTFTITQPTAIASSISSQTNVACNGGNNGAVTITASGGAGGFTYTWSPSGGNAATASALTSGNYTCTITDANSCTKTQTVTITQPLVISSSISSQINITCNGGSNGSATVSASGGTGALTYTWSPSGGNAASATALAAGNYTCTIKDANNCTKTQTVTITQPTAISSVPSQTNLTCNGSNNGIANVSASGGTGALTYSWSPSGGTSATASALGAGNYTCTIKDANNCTKTQTFTITQPLVVSATATSTLTTFCQGGSTTLNGNATGGTGAFTYNWSPGGPGASIVVSPTVTSTYTLTATDANSCIGTKTITITVNPTPTITMAGGAICPGNSFTLNPSGASTYTFSSGPVVSPSSTTSYTVTGTSAAGCVSGQAVATVTVAGTLTVTIAGSNTVCNGSSINLVAGGATTYTWNTGATTTTITPTPTVNTTYSVTGASGSCSNTAMFSVTVNPTPTVSAVTSTSLICVGQSATLTANGANTYTWNPGGAGTSITVSPTVTATYTVTGTNASGCTNVTTITQNVSGCVGINQIAIQGNEINIYPNPFNNKITIGTNGEKQTVQIFNVLGEMVFTSQIVNEKTEIDLSKEQSGIYFVRIGSVTKKIIKE